jgi:bifunctional UDP-N-acetylglucosamine pyrophosphorylase/glucosamine-1-phosphate N-acetyltransferase
LSERLLKIKPQNAQGEFYLTDIVDILATENVKTGVVRGEYMELRGVNSRAQLAELENFYQMQKRVQIMNEGVTLLDPNTVWFSHDTKIGADCMIEPSVVFGPNVVIDPHVTIKSFSCLEGVHVKSGASIGPFARIRPQTIIEQDVKIGNFVEVKNSKIGKGSKANHLGYIGDTIIGSDANFGCGAITVNYDGKDKFKTEIGDHVMVGSNATLIAPLTIEDGAYIAAGSTVTENAPPDSLVFGRAKTVIKEGRGKNRLKKKS